MVLPVGEETDAVATEEDLVEVMFELRDGEVFVDGLGDLEGGLDVEGDAGGDAEGSEIDDGAEKLFAVFGAREAADAAVGGDELDGGDGGGEVAVVAAGAVGGGGAGSDDGDVGERGEIVDGEAAGVNVGRQLAVGYAGADGDGSGFRVESYLVELLERDLIFGAVGDAVERVAGAKGTEFGAVFDDLLDLFNGCGLVEIIGAEGVVSGPVGARRGRLRLGVDVTGEQGAGDERAGGFEELSFVHVWNLDSVELICAY